MAKKRIDFTIDSRVVDLTEEIFCYRVVEGEKVRMRSLSSVAREAFLRGLRLMIEEKKKLDEVFGRNVLLTEEGYEFV